MISPSFFPLGTSVSDLEIRELGADSDMPLCHIYPEAQVLTPDGRFVVLQSYGDTHPDYTCPLDERARLWLVDLENERELLPLGETSYASSPVISPDGRFCYYFEQERPGEPTRLKRYSFTQGVSETVTTLDHIGDSLGRARLHKVGPLATIRSDGNSLAIPFSLTGADVDYPEWALLVIDLQSLHGRIILRGPSWRNIHAQYCRAVGSRDLLVQENHGVVFQGGRMTQLVGGPGADIHVISDDGSDFRCLPWGRLEKESCRGHQCWRGESELALGALTVSDGDDGELIRLVESPPVRYSDHIGGLTPGGIRNDLSSEREMPLFDHFATDRSGKILISDGKRQGRWFLQLAELQDPLQGPLGKVKDLLEVGMVIHSPQSARYHPHPFLSPDGRTGFFNSNITGRLKPYMIKNYDLG